MTDAPKPRPGDVVVDSEGRRHIIDSSYFEADFHDGRGLCLMAVRNPMNGSGYREDEYVSTSGGPCPFIPIARLTHKGETEQHFWRFKDGRVQAHNAEHYKMTVQLFEWEGS